MSHKHTNRAEPVITNEVILGEGVIWDDKNNLLYWLDIYGDKVFVYDPLSGKNTTLNVPGNPSSIVPKKSGGALVTLKNGFASIDLSTGKTTMIAKTEESIESNRFNDGKCDPAGRFWAGTMDFDINPDKGALYVLHPDFKVEKKLDQISCSNGIVWSLDQKTMYYIDSPRQTVDAFDFEVDSGKISSRRTVVSISKDVGIPDGMAIDEEGMLWVAIFGGSRVCRYDPSDGSLLSTIEVPGASCTTSCAFGGSDFRDLYITTANVTVASKGDSLEKHKNGGYLFKVKVDVPGVPTFSFDG